MITIEQALAIYLEKHPTHTVSSILDVGDEWVIAVRDKKTGLDLDISPTAVSKASGELRVFFPPANKEKLVNARTVQLDGLKLS